MIQEDKKLKRRIRHSYLVSTISIAMVLFLLGSTAYFISNIFQETNTWRESIKMNLMLNNAHQEVYDSLGTILKDSPQVNEVKFIDKETAAEEFQKEIGEDFVAFIGSNPLPNSFEITLKAEASRPEQVDSLAKVWGKWNDVMEVVYPQSTYEAIEENVSRFSTASLMIAVSLLIITLVLLRNTIRMTINTRLQLIDTMRLVGATRWFIMRPFLGRSIINGIIAGFIASLMLFGMIVATSRQLPELTFVMNNTVLLTVCAGITILGIILSMIFTATAVNRAIHLRGGELYL